MDTIIVTMIRRPPKADPKQRSLEESGTANPHAQDVRDPAFIDSDFFDPRDLIQVKYEMLRRVRTEGQSIPKASAMFGMSRPTFYKAERPGPNTPIKYQYQRKNRANSMASAVGRNSINS